MIYGMIDVTHGAKVPFAVVGCSETPWPILDPVGYRFHLEGYNGLPCCRAAYCRVQKQFPTMPLREKGYSTLQDFIDCGASFVVRALLELHTYIGCQFEFYKVHEIIFNAEREKRATFKYLNLASRTVVGEEIVKVLRRTTHFE